MEWTIKQTAELTGISADTLRYYEKEGILTPRRHENGYRTYSEEDVASLKNIVVMKYAQFSLAEMRSMEALYHLEPSAGCNEIGKGILNEKITQLKQTIANYQNIVKLMEELLPLIDTSDAYYRNKGKIDAFIGQIYEDIRREN